MRLVSALYNTFYPFHNFALGGKKVFSEFISTRDPEFLKKGDVLVVWGGGDIHPSLYKKNMSQQSGAGLMPSDRDRVEWALMNRARELNIPIIGVCRGAQMLCALAGGYLIQHVSGHGGKHYVVTNEGETYITNSIHHQMMMPGNAKHNVLAEIPRHQLLSSVYMDEDEDVKVDHEFEFLHFPDVKGLAVQWHPEGMEIRSAATQHIFREMGERFEW